MASWISRLINSVAVPRVSPYKTTGVGGGVVVGGYVRTEERNSELVGDNRYRTYSNIMTNTSIVAAGMRYFLTLLGRPVWKCEPANDTAEAKEMAEFVEEVLFERLATPWARVVKRAGTARFVGFSVQEWTAVRRPDGRIGFSDIEQRPQRTIQRWAVDDKGKVLGMYQTHPVSSIELAIPRKKTLYLVDDTLNDSPEGMGLLRHCVDPARRLEEYLYQESTGFLRDLRGIPIGRAPMEELELAVQEKKITKEQKQAALDALEQFVTLQKVTSKTGLILNSETYHNDTESGQSKTAVPKWGIDLVTGTASGLTDVGVAIQRLNHEMARILGTEHLLLGSDGSGSLALGKDKSTNLYILGNSVLGDVAFQVDIDLVDPLWELNGFDPELKPKTRCEDIAIKDVEQITRALKDLATAGAPVSPDDPVQNDVRDLLGVAHADLDRLLEDKEQADLRADTQTGVVPGVDGEEGEEGEEEEESVTKRGDRCDFHFYYEQAEGLGLTRQQMLKNLDDHELLKLDEFDDPELSEVARLAAAEELTEIRELRKWMLNGPADKVAKVRIRARV